VIITCRHEQLGWDGRIRTTHCNPKMLISRKPHLIGVGVELAVVVTIPVANMSLSWPATSSFLTHRVENSDEGRSGSSIGPILDC
jgi:hypothetical protein